MQQSAPYWHKAFGIELFKVRYCMAWLLYKAFRIGLPKLRDQRAYWEDRGKVYMDEIIRSGYLDRELFFQNMLIDQLKELEFGSCFEAGSGFGWNLKRIRNEFPGTKVSGLDFSLAQIVNSNRYLKSTGISVVNGDNCIMPFKDNAFDIGFSLGVFMNIHPSRIIGALQEMARVCRRFIVHIEYDADRTTRELREKRAFKRNIVSHDYGSLYTSLGKKILRLSSYVDFGKDYNEYKQSLNSHLNRWEGFEGPEKYIFIVIEV